VTRCSPLDVATNLLEACNAGDLDRMRELLAPDLIAWVTNADGEADRVTGRTGRWELCQVPT
jgi:hypothetical protein